MHPIIVLTTLDGERVIFVLFNIMAILPGKAQGSVIQTAIGNYTVKESQDEIAEMIMRGEAKPAEPEKKEEPSQPPA